VQSIAWEILKCPAWRVGALQVIGGVISVPRNGEPWLRPRGTPKTRFALLPHGRPLTQEVTLVFKIAALTATLFFGSAWWPGTGWAQEGQFGGQARADAVTRMIVLAVQQGIDSLPPTSGQAFGYEYEPGSDIPVREKQLGPTALRATETVGESHLSVRVATSYFELGESFGPMTYFIQPQDTSLAEPRGYADFGLEARAKVGLVNLAVNWGFASRLEATFNLPLVVVDAQASQSFTTQPQYLNLPPRSAILSGAPTIDQLNSLLKNGSLVFRKETFRDLGFDFNEGTHVGVGRISLGAKGIAYSSQALRLAVAAELFLPSPNENQFAGPASPAVLPRAIAAVPIGSRLKWLADAGYDYDFDNAELRRFVWNSGASFAIGSQATLDAGVGGSEFNKAITWTPAVAYGIKTGTYPATVLTTQAGNRLGDSFVDFLGGVKLRLTDRLAFSGAVNVPLNNQGFRPAALGTLALETYF